MSNTQTWKAGTVSADWLGGAKFPAEISDHDWNGWAVPRFTREVTGEIIEDMMRYPEHERGHQDLSWHTDPEDGTEYVRIEDLPTGNVEFVAPDLDGFYPLGAWSWTWTVAETVMSGATFQIPVEFFVTVEDGQVTKMVVSPLESAAYYFGGPSFEVEHGKADPEIHLWPAVVEHLAARTEKIPGDYPATKIEVHWEE